MPRIQITAKVVKGNIAGIVATDNFSQQILDSRIGNKYVIQINEPQDAYLREKYFQLITLVCELDEKLLGKINRYAAMPNYFPNEAALKNCIRKSLSVIVGIVEMDYFRITNEWGEVEVLERPKAKSVAEMNNDELSLLYSLSRDFVFNLCKENDYNDLMLFQKFGCLYLGFPMSDMELVEEQIGLLDESATIKYLQLAKMLQQPLTVEMFEAQQNKI